MVDHVLCSPSNYKEFLPFRDHPALAKGGDPLIFGLMQVNFVLL